VFRYITGDRGRTVVKVLCYKSEGRWFDPSWCQWNFFIDIKSFRSHRGPGADSRFNRNEYQEYILGIKAAGAKGLVTPCSERTHITYNETLSSIANTTTKGKAVPLQAWSGPEGSRKLHFPDFMTTAQDGGKVVSITHRPHLPLGNPPGTHFC